MHTKNLQNLASASPIEENTQSLIFLGPPMPKAPYPKLSPIGKVDRPNLHCDKSRGMFFEIEGDIPTEMKPTLKKDFKDLTTDELNNILESIDQGMQNNSSLEWMK